MVCCILRILIVLSHFSNTEINYPLKSTLTLERYRNRRFTKIKGSLLDKEWLKVKDRLLHRISIRMKMRTYMNLISEIAIKLHLEHTLIGLRMGNRTMKLWQSHLVLIAHKFTSLKLCSSSRRSFNHLDRRIRGKLE